MGRKGDKEHAMRARRGRKGGKKSSRRSVEREARKGKEGKGRVSIKNKLAFHNLIFDRTQQERDARPGVLASRSNLSRVCVWGGWLRFGCYFSFLSLLVFEHYYYSTD